MLMVNRFKCNNLVATFVLIVLLFMFIVFTYNAPNIGIFKNPVTGKYGIH